MRRNINAHGLVPGILIGIYFLFIDRILTHIPVC